jgi:hypothetical protein
MSEAERVEVDCGMDDVASGENVRCFAEDGRLAGPMVPVMMSNDSVSPPPSTAFRTIVAGIGRSVCAFARANAM